MKTTKPMRLLAAALVAAGLSTGCSLELPKVEAVLQQKPGPTGGPQDPSLQALAVIDDALAADRQFELRMPPPPTAPPPAAPVEMSLAPTGPAKPPAMYCDAVPELTIEKICGLDVVTKAHVAWTGCQLPAPQQTDGTQPQQPAPAETEGVLDTETVVTHSVCSPVTEVTYTRHTAFSLTKKTADDTSTTAGDIDTTGTQAAAPGNITRTMSLDMTASVPATDGTHKEFTLQGELTVTLALEKDKPPVTSLDGTLTRAGDAPETYLVKAVERGDPKACRWPVTGEIARTLPSGEKHVISFGPECGQATLDGKQVSLNPQPQQQPGGEQPPQQH